MAVRQIVFSPTGGTQRVADIVSDALVKHGVGDNASAIDLSNPHADFSAMTLDAGDVAVIAMPSFGGRVPAPATERLAKVKGAGARCVLVCVYGNRAYEDTLVEMEDAAHAAGFKVVAAMAAIAEHSMMHQYAAGRPDDKDREALEDMVAAIAQKLQDEHADEEPTNIPGNRPYKKAGKGMVPKASSACVACGLCARRCPVQAIDPSDPKKVKSDACIGCMRCVSVCPHEARALNGAMLAAASLALKKACSTRKEPELYL
ncbi:4Fe-4S binding protein [Collinsella sp. An2]|uniref:4Fe-4S binding protein n=1 Tax=Collinsella sp. An2 TaxID=1965585 RepID=UPI000B36E100|nr:4Fe-4S binding protein [Collinsella sp. An2]OUP11105.1 4Fe-4S ferredoxin [Collinsella sp. An2]